jgi:hypothetical protein
MALTHNTESEQGSSRASNFDRRASIAKYSGADDRANNNELPEVSYVDEATTHIKGYRAKCVTYEDHPSLEILPSLS